MDSARAKPAFFFFFYMWPTVYKIALNLLHLLPSNLQSPLYITMCVMTKNEKSHKNPMETKFKISTSHQVLVFTGEIKSLHLPHSLHELGFSSGFIVVVEMFSFIRERQWSPIC